MCDDAFVCPPDARPLPTEADRASAYERLFKARIISVVSAWGYEKADQIAKAEWEAADITDFSDDPEMAADECLSYWDDDDA